MIKLLEKRIEQYFKKRVEEDGTCKCFKFVSPGTAGVPDRIVLKKTGKIYFVELKRPGAEPRPLQVYVFKIFKNYGFPVYVLDTKEAVDKFIKRISR